MKALQIIKLSVVGYIFLAPLFIFAQMPGIEQSFSLSFSPQNPSPGELVTFGVSAYEFNIDLANIVWSVDGKSVKSGKGVKGFTFEAPANGKSSTISVVVSPATGTPIEKSITISPADIDLIYEVMDGYVPPFYRGKILPIKQSQIKVVALPNVKTMTGGTAKAKDFVYTWRKDSENLPGQSGFGRSSVTFVNEILDRGNTLEVSATNGLKKVDGAIVINYLEPEILFYEYDILTGVKYQRAFRSGENIKQPKLSIIAEPYFLSRDFMPNKDIAGTWMLNGQKATPVAKNNLIINTSATSGKVDISFEYNEAKRLFRSFKKSLSLNLVN